MSYFVKICDLLKDLQKKIGLFSSGDLLLFFIMWELDSIKFPNNFVLKKSNNLFKSNKTTNFNKKTHFKPTCLCIVRYVRFIDTIQFIHYTPMYRTIHKHLLYDFTIRNFLYTIRYVSGIVRY